MSGERQRVRVVIEPDRVERIQWAVQARRNQRGGVWSLATAMWRFEDPDPGRWPQYLLFKSRAAARACAQQLRWAYAPDGSGWPEKPRFLFREVRVRERISVIA